VHNFEAPWRLRIGHRAQSDIRGVKPNEARRPELEEGAEVCGRSSAEYAAKELVANHRSHGALHKVAYDKKTKMTTTTKK